MSGVVTIERAVGQSAGIRWRRLLAEQRALWFDDAPSWMVVGSPSNENVLFAVANGREAQRRMGEVLTAFLGPTMPRVVVPNPVELPDDWIVERVSVTNPDAADQALQKMNAVRSEYVHESRVALRSVDVLLRELHFAVDARNETLSMRLLEAILESGLLSQENTMFLRVKVLATFGSWREIRSLLFFDDLAQMRRPSLITSCLLEALWHVDLPPGAEFFDGAKLREAFEAQGLGRRYRDLFCSVECPSSPSARAMVALHCAHIEDSSRLDLLLRGAPEPERQQLRHRAGLPSLAKRAHTDHAEVSRLYREGDFVGVVQCFEGNEIPLHCATELLLAAVEIADPDLARRIIAASNLQELRTSATRSQLLALENLERVALGAAGWPVWAHHLARGEWENCIELAREHSHRWSTDWLGDRRVVDEFVRDLEAATGNAAADRLSDIALELLDLVALSAGQPGFRDLQELVLTAVVLQHWDGEGARRGVVRLLGHLDLSGLPVTSDLVDAVGALWERDGSTSSLPWLVQCLELLARHNEVASDVERVAAKMSSLVVRLAPKVEPVWVELFRRYLPEATRRVVSVPDGGQRTWHTDARRRVLVGCRGWNERETVAFVRELLGDDAVLLKFGTLDASTSSVREEFDEVDLLVVSTSQSRSPAVDLGLWACVRVVDATTPSALLAALLAPG